MSFEEELSRGQEERSFDTLYLISYYLKFISAFLLRSEFLKLVQLSLHFC